MVFAHADHAAAALIDRAVGIAEPVLWSHERERRDRPGRLSGGLGVKTLIGVVREIDDAVMGRERAAAVFMRARPDIEKMIVIGRHALRLPATNQPVDEGSALLLRLRFGPIDRVAVERDLAQPDRVGDDEIGGDRGGPRPIGTDDHWLSSIVFPSKTGPAGL